jgi:hypothetical protein
MLTELLLSLFVVASPIPPPSPSAVLQLSKLPNKSKSVIIKNENNAPIPDSLKDRFEVLETSSGIVIELEIPKTEELVRLPGPNYTWPHGGCYMCLGNYMITKFGQSKAYLDKIGYEKWGILYDNLHNDPAYKGVKGVNEGYYGSNHNCMRQRVRLFRRWRR